MGQVEGEQEASGQPRSARVVLAALLGNVTILLAKLAAFVVTGSASMLSEAMHSLADTANQGTLAVGIRQSRRGADPEHPYGYGRARFVWALVSAVGVLFVGCGVSIYSGIEKVLEPEPLDHLGWAFIVLGVAFVGEGITFTLALRSVRHDARRQEMSVWRYLREGSDPMGVAVFFEDGAALIGVLLAAGALLLTRFLGDPVWDGIGSIAIGVLLGFSAIFLMNKNRDLLVGRAIPPNRRARILRILRRDPVVEGVYDVKSVLLGSDLGRFKAEVEFDGTQVARKFLADVDLDELLERLRTREDLERFLIQYADHIVEALGDEVDRLEEEIRKAAPEVRHIDIETD
ncbi:MAG: cation diffusion facilitator family transporter [Myxococcota bacterium]